MERNDNKNLELVSRKEKSDWKNEHILNEDPQSLN